MRKTPLLPASRTGPIIHLKTPCSGGGQSPALPLLPRYGGVAWAPSRGAQGHGPRQYSCFAVASCGMKGLSFLGPVGDLAGSWRWRYSAGRGRRAAVHGAPGMPGPAPRRGRRLGCFFVKVAPVTWLSAKRCACVQQMLRFCWWRPGGRELWRRLAYFDLGELPPRARRPARPRGAPTRRRLERSKLELSRIKQRFTTLHRLTPGACGGRVCWAGCA